jgi:hypothetical protein
MFKLIKLVAIIIVGLVVLGIVGAIVAPKPDKRQAGDVGIAPSESAAVKPPAIVPSAPTPPAVPEAAKFLPGINPSDIYLSLEKQGFKTTKNLKANWGEWRSSRTVGDVEQTVEVFSSKASAVEYVNATVLSTGTAPVATSASGLFSFLGSVPYDGANPSEAAGWAAANTASGGSTTIGGVTFTITANPDAPRARLMRVALEGR